MIGVACSRVGRPRRILIPNECRRVASSIGQGAACGSALVPAVESTPATLTAAARSAFAELFESPLASRVTVLRASKRAAVQRAAEPAALPSAYGTTESERGASIPASAEPRATSLDYSGTTDPGLENPDAVPELAADPPRACFLDAAGEGNTRAGVPLSYLATVETETTAHRIARAARHQVAARLAARGLRELPTKDFGAPELEAIAPRIPVVSGGLTKRERKELAGKGNFSRARSSDERAECARASDRSVRWHQGRARGALERFRRVTDCGSKRVHVHCNACNCMHDVADRCACPRLCLACREASRRTRLAKIATARERVLGNAKRGGLLNRHRKGGAWGERMITLTVPHVIADRWETEARGEGSSVKTRVDALLGAWRAFYTRMQKWVRSLRRPIAWYRAFEWTPGADGEGHPHFHIWMFSPFLPVASIRRWWRKALAGEGIHVEDRRCTFGHSGRGPTGNRTPLAHATSPEISPRPKGSIGDFCLPFDLTCRRIGRPSYRRTCPHGFDVIVDVRAGDDKVRLEAAKGKIALKNSYGETVTRYIEGWSIIDAAEGGRVSPAIVARLYEALEGKRLVQSSKGLLERSRTGCSECGAVGWTRVELVDPALPSVTSPTTCRRLEAPPLLGA